MLSMKETTNKMTNAQPITQNIQNVGNGTTGPVLADRRKRKKKTKYSTLPRERYKSKYDQRRCNKNVHTVDNDNCDYYEFEFHTINNLDCCAEVTSKLKIQVPGREKTQ